MSQVALEAADERWAPVLGWESDYQVSDQGRVQSASRIVRFCDGRSRLQAARILSVSTSNGYPKVDLKRNGSRRTVRIHTLVLEAFVGECPDGMECLHRNGNGLDNRLSNLHWGTPSQNKYDTVQHGTHRNVRKSHCPKGHEYTAENTWFHKGHKPGQRQRVCRTCHYERIRK